MDTYVANKRMYLSGFILNRPAEGKLTGSRDLRAVISRVGYCLSTVRSKNFVSPCTPCTPETAEGGIKLCFGVAYAKFVWGSGLSWR